MRKLLLTTIVGLLIMLGGCRILPTKAPDVKTTIATTIKDKAEESNLGQLVLLEKNQYFIAPLILSLFTGTILFFSGMRKIGISIIASSILCITLLYALSLYSKFVALTGLFLLLIAIYVLGRTLYDKSLLQRELVASVEVSKVMLDEEDKKTLGKRLGNIQSEFTQKVVKKIKKPINK